MVHSIMKEIDCYLEQITDYLVSVYIEVFPVEFVKDHYASD